MSPRNPSPKKSLHCRMKRKPNLLAITRHNTSQQPPEIKKDETIQTNDPLKAVDLPPLLPTTDNNATEKCSSTTKNIHVSNDGVQPMQDIPKTVQSNTLSTKMDNMPKLLKINGKSETTEMKKTKTKNVSATKYISRTASSSLNGQKPSGIPPLHLIDKPSTSKTGPAKPSTPNHKEQRKQIGQSQPRTPTSKVKRETKKETPKAESNDGKKRTGKKSRKSKNPDGSTPRIENVYIADGLKEDCERLVERCLQVFKLNFEKFCEIWKEMNFPCIYHGRQSGAELAELSEEAIIIAKAHMVAKNVSFEENVAGLFLVYGFLNHQPYKEFASLRLVPGDVPSVLHLEAEARRQRRYDVLYILGHVLIKGPVQYHVLPREVALEMPIRKYHDGSVQISGTKVNSVFTKTADCVHHFRQAIAADQRYAAIRQRVNDRLGAAVDRVRHLSAQPAAALFNTYREHIPGGATFERDLEDIMKESKAPEAKEENRQDTVRSIKQRAMAQAVEPMRHLTGVTDRQNDSLQSSPESETEKALKTNARYKGKGKGKGKGRSSAQTLHSLFAEEKPSEKEAPPQPSQKAMPTLNMSEDLITVTYKSVPAPKKRPTSPTSDDKPPNKLSKLEMALTKPSKKLTKDKPIPGNAENLVENNSATEADVEMIEIPDKSADITKTQPVSGSNFDSNKSTRTAAVVLALRNSKTKAESTNKAKMADAVNLTGTKSKAKDINIKDIQIIKPADNLNLEKVVPPHEEAVKIKLDKLPIEIHSADKNIEVKISDKFKKGIESKKGNAATSKKDLNTEISSISKKPSTKKASTSVFDVNKTMMLSTDQIDARFQRRKIRESRKAKNKYTVEVFHDSASECDLSDESEEKNKRDPNMPSAEDIESRKVPKERRDLKRLRIKSTFKKMGIMEVADLKNNEDDSCSREAD